MCLSVEVSKCVCGFLSFETVAQQCLLAGEAGSRIKISNFVSAMSCCSGCWIVVAETWSGVLLFHIDLPVLRLREHKALLLGQQDPAPFGLFDQLNTAVDGEHFHLLSAGLPRILNTCTQANTHLHMYINRHPQVAGVSLSLKNWLLFIFLSKNWQTINKTTLSPLNIIRSQRLNENKNIRRCCFQHCADFQSVWWFWPFFRTAVCYASAHFFAFTLQLTVEDRLIGAALCSVMLQWAGI